MISALSCMTIESPNHSNGRNGERVCKFTPHYMGGDCSVETCGEIFKPTSRQASSNYGIGSDGRVACYVDEDNRAWTSSSGWNDRKAITVEVANKPDGSITDEAWASLVALGADVCRRHGFRLKYTGTRDGTLTEHRMFANTDCPGEWLHANMARLASEVNAALDGAPAPAQPGAPAETGGGFEGGTYRVNSRKGLNVRDAPSLSGKIVATYKNGKNVILDSWYTVADGYVWGRYTGRTSGLKRYVAVGRATGKPEADDLLVKA